MKSTFVYRNSCFIKSHQKLVLSLLYSNRVRSIKFTPIRKYSWCSQQATSSYFKGSLAREQLKVPAQRHRAHILIAQKEREKVRYSGPLPLLAIIQGMAINGILVSINARLPKGEILKPRQMFIRQRHMSKVESPKLHCPLRVSHVERLLTSI